MKPSIIAVVVLGLAVISDHQTALAAKQSVTARLTIEGCYESEVLLVPVNRSFRRGGIGIGGGGNGSCNYSYNLRAVRIDPNRINLFIDVTVAGRSFEKQMVLTRGKPLDTQLELGVRLRVHF